MSSSKKNSSISEEKMENEEQILVASPEMCIHAFDVIINELLQGHENSNHSIDTTLLESIPENTQCPLFVTWDKKHHSDFRLRGCIGTLAPQQLIIALGDYAVTSAFRDHRFNPICSEEIKDLRVGVSLLVNYEKCDNCYDWKVGIHGIIIKFRCPSTRYEHNATFLPEVAEQQAWTREQTVEFLVRKSGYKGQITQTLLSEIDCTRYQSSKHRMVYDDYVKTIGKDPIQESFENGGSKPILKNWRQFFQK